MHLRIPLPPKQQIKENKTEIKTNASAHSLAPQTTDIRKHNRNQQECICAFPCPPNNRHKKTEQKSKGMHLRITLPPKQKAYVNRPGIKRNASAHSLAPQTTDIRKHNRNQQECICAFPCPPNKRHKKTEQKSKGMHLRIPLPPKQQT